MACIGLISACQSSSRAQALESKASIHRYLEEVPLTPDEKAIAEGDIDKLTAFIKKWLVSQHLKKTKPYGLSTLTKLIFIDVNQN
jgi:hypothetical protein